MLQRLEGGGVCLCTWRAAHPRVDVVCARVLCSLVVGGGVGGAWVDVYPHTRESVCACTAGWAACAHPGSVRACRGVGSARVHGSGCRGAALCGIKALAGSGRGAHACGPWPRFAGVRGGLGCREHQHRVRNGGWHAPRLYKRGTSVRDTEDVTLPEPRWCLRGLQSCSFPWEGHAQMG